MGNSYVLAVAPEGAVQHSIDELLTEGVCNGNTTLVSTKKYRHSELTKAIDLEVDSLNEEVSFSYTDQDKLVVVQFNETLISFVNVYRFLRANGVGDFAIKVAGKPLIETSVTKVFEQFYDEHLPEPESLHWISPAEISKRHEFPPAYFGQEVAGDWDQQYSEFEQSVLFYHSMKQRAEQGIAWSQTDYYQDVAASLGMGESRFGCRTLAQFEQRCVELDRLYEDMRQNGWQQRQGDDYVSINIGRDGEVFFNDGRHRLAIAKLLGIKKIPVKVAVRHRLWNEFKNEIRSFANKFYAGKVYARINHFDLADMPFSQEDERLEVISSQLNSEARTLLDIGSHWGYFCSGFEELGLSCTAVEADVANFYFLDKLRKAANKSFNAHCKSIFDVVNKGDQYDVVLALNIFHHFIKTADKHAQLVTLLNDLDMNEMYLQTHCPSEPQMQDSFKNYAGHEFAEFVVAHSCLNTIELLVSYDSGRMLFKLSR